MHPVTRVASFLVIAVSLAQLNQQKLITAAIILLLLFFAWPSPHVIQKTTKLVFRLRWLFLSLFIIYAWFTPGTLLIPGWGYFSPYKEGSVMGLMRIMSLIIILSSLSLLVLNQTRDELINAIYWYCQPLKIFGLSPQRLLARLVLTIESVAKLESRWVKTASTPRAMQTGIQNSYQRILQLFETVIDSAETDELKTISIALLERPVWYQWLFPVSLLVIFLFAW